MRRELDRIKKLRRVLTKAAAEADAAISQEAHLISKKTKMSVDVIESIGKVTRIIVKGSDPRPYAKTVLRLVADYELAIVVKLADSDKSPPKTMQEKATDKSCSGVRKYSSVAQTLKGCAKYSAESLPIIIPTDLRRVFSTMPTDLIPKHRSFGGYTVLEGQRVMVLNCKAMEDSSPLALNTVFDMLVGIQSSEDGEQLINIGESLGYRAHRKVRNHKFSWFVTASLYNEISKNSKILSWGFPF